MGINIEGLDKDNALRKKIEAKIGKTPTKSSGSNSKPNDFEHELQCRAIEYFRTKYPMLGRSLFAIPNAGKRSAFIGKYFKDEGLLAGVWDLFLCVPRGTYGGCFIETKWGNNNLSASQELFRTANRESYQFFVYRSLDEFIRMTSQYLEQQ